MSFNSYGLFRTPSIDTNMYYVSRQRQSFQCTYDNVRKSYRVSNIIVYTQYVHNILHRIQSQSPKIQSLE